MTRLLLLTLLLSSLASQAQTDCTQFNKTYNGPTHSLSGTYAHLSGNHNWKTNGVASCSYSGAAGTACNTSCYVRMVATPAEAGSLDTDHSQGNGGGNPLAHAIAVGYTSASSGAGGGAAASCGNAMDEVAVRQCIKGAPCAVPILPAPGGFTLPSGTVWADPFSFSYTCPGKTAPAAPPPPPPVCLPTQPVPPSSGYNMCPYWDYTYCHYAWQSCGTSPIIIDTDGSGYHLTSAEEGVGFDFYGTGKKIQIAWTAAGSTNGWLVLPSADGQIHSARENFFGNLSPQAKPSKDPNGFLALAVYDKNGDGVIDVRDSIWSRLRIWVDANHDGIAQPAELYTLPQKGIFNIALAYTLSQRTDPNGNQFRFRGMINVPGAGLHPMGMIQNRMLLGKEDPDHTIWDVFLEVASPVPTPASLHSHARLP